MEYIDNDDYEEKNIWPEEILDQFKSGVKKQSWTLIKASKLKKLYKDHSMGIIDTELLEEVLSIIIENLQKILANSYILHYTDEISDEEVDRWNEFIDDGQGNGRYTEQVERFGKLLRSLLNARTNEQKIIALDSILATSHGIGYIAGWFVEGGVETLDDIFKWRPKLEEHIGA